LAETGIEADPEPESTLASGAAAEAASAGDAVADVEPAGCVLQPDAPEEAIEQDPDSAGSYDTAAAAAALARAASEIIGAMEEPSGRVRLTELAGLIDEIDREIAASTAADSAELSPRDEKLERYVVFRLGGNSYGLHMEAVREVEKVGRVTAVPGAPPLLCGLINLRGEILPLVDPKPALGLDPARGTPSGYLVVVQAAEEDPPVALMVDELGGVALVDPQELALQLDHDEAGAPGGGRMRGKTQHRGRSVELLDHRRLFTAEALLEQVEG
jgi:purine-binding chemotaxis protein CheW